MKHIALSFLLLILISCNENHHLTEKLNAQSLGKCMESSVLGSVISLGSGTAGDPYVICNVRQLQSINNDLAAFYQLGKNIDASETSGWTDGTSGIGFIPIAGCGSDYTDCSLGREFFSGSFDGCGYTIDSLTINRTRGAVGLFGASSPAAVITDVRMTNASITGSEDTGGIVARLYHNLSQVYFSGSVNGDGPTGGISAFSEGDISFAEANVIVNCSGSKCGGIVGDTTGSIVNAIVSGSVTGQADTGGAIGESTGFGESITNIRSTATVNGTGTVGGLIGYNRYPGISKSSASGDVTATGGRVGGLVGESAYAQIEDSYAIGNVSGTGRLGGLIGTSNDTDVARSFATGDITGTGTSIGAFAGQVIDFPAFRNSFATGNVFGPPGPSVGGFTGDFAASIIINSFHNTTESTFYDPTDDVYALALPPWDFTNVWHSPGNITLPTLR